MAQRRGTLARVPLYYCATSLFSEDPLMRALISLFAAALLFAAGCSKTNDAARQDNPTPPADQSATPSTMPPADQPPPSDTTTPPPADQATPPAPDQQTPPQSQ